MSDRQIADFDFAERGFLHRRFFAAGIVSLFSAGAVLGAVLLAMLAWRRDLTVLELRPAIWAHAHAQIAGWLTYFVMGFAYEVFPRWKRVPLPHPALAKATLATMAAGLVLRVGAGFFDETSAGQLAGVAGGLLELAAVCAFLVAMARAWRLSAEPRRPWERFVLAAFGWMALAFVADLAVFSASGSIRGERAWIEFIGLYDAPWRDIQLLGFAAGMVIGVGQRLLPAVYGFREIPERRAHALFWLWNGAIAGQIVGYVAFFQTRQWPFALAWWAAVAAMGAVFATAAVEMRLFARRAAPDRSLPFLRAAYLWAGVATAMLHPPRLQPRSRAGILARLVRRLPPRPDGGLPQLDDRRRVEPGRAAPGRGRSRAAERSPAGVLAAQRRLRNAGRLPGCDRLRRLGVRAGGAERAGRNRGLRPLGARPAPDLAAGREPPRGGAIRSACGPDRDPSGGGEVSVMRRPSGSCVALLALLAPAAAAQTPAEAPPPPDPSRPVATLNRQTPSWLSVGAAYRFRFETRSGNGFRRDANEGFGLNRLLVDIGVQPRSWLNFHFQGQDARAPGKRGATPVFRDPFDVRQAWVRLGDPRKHLVRATVGRQELLYGAQRLVGPLDWTNTARQFDAAKLTVGREDLSLDIFAAAPVVLDDGGRNRRAPGANLHGMYAKLDRWAGQGILETYTFWKTTPRTLSEMGAAGDADLFTSGFRVKRPLPGRFDVEAEVARQYGDRAGDTISAWGGYWIAGYRPPGLAWSPRLSVEYQYGSGDSDQADGRLETFDQLFPTGHLYQGVADRVGWRNIENVRAGVGFAPRNGVSVVLDYFAFWLASRRDHLYGVDGRIAVRAPPGGAAESFVGHEADIVVSWRLRENVTTGGGFGVFVPGAFLRETTPGRRHLFGYLFLNYVL